MRGWAFSRPVSQAGQPITVARPRSRFGTLLAPSAQAAKFIDFIDNSAGTFAFGLLGDNTILCGSWSQAVASNSTAVSAIIRRHVDAPGHAWLLNQIGPGTTAANILAETDFLAPVITDIYDLTSAPYTTFFTGLNLAPGTYYLVLQGPKGPYANNYDWLGDLISVGINVAPGFAVGPYAGTSFPDAFVPASDFETYEGDGKFFYRVEGILAPLPGSLLLLGPALTGLLAWRRLT